MTDLPKAVIVEWKDAKHGYGWQGGNLLVTVDLPSVFSIGWLLEKNRDGVVLAQTWHEQNHAQTITIPRGMIVQIVDLPLEIS